MDNNIDLFRTRAGLTVQNLADQIGCAREHLQALKSGRKGLTEDVLVKLASALCVEPWQLIKVPLNAEDEDHQVELIRQLGEATAIAMERSKRNLNYCQYLNVVLEFYRIVRANGGTVSDDAMRMTLEAILASEARTTSDTGGSPATPPPRKRQPA